MKKITVHTLIIMGIHLGIYLVLLIGGGSVSGLRILLFAALSLMGTFGIQFLLFSEQEKMNQQTKRSLQAFNDGNFIVDVEEQYRNSFYKEINDQLADLKKMLNQWVYQLLTSSVSVKNSADRIYRFSENTKQSMYEMSMATQEIAKFFEDMADRLNQVSNAVTVLNDTSTKIASSTNKAKSQVNQANLDADEGGQAVAIMSESMQKISREVTNAQHTVVELGNITERIQSITESITAISSQTNLLALNASIEAARAGEHGKGFSVVAQEVRKLAEESRSSAEKINNLVIDVRNAVQNTKESMEVVEADVKHGVGVTGQAITSFEKIKENVNIAATLMADIAKDIAEQSEKTSTISLHTVDLADLGQIGTANA
ncbi:MAG: methyl-accepting chemotaxis protein, partial [Mobilitalea sp.]